MRHMLVGRKGHLAMLHANSHKLTNSRRVVVHFSVTVEKLSAEDNAHYAAHITLFLCAQS